MQIPARVRGVPTEVLLPANTWADQVGLAAGACYLCLRKVTAIAVLPRVLLAATCALARPCPC